MALLDRQKLWVVGLVFAVLATVVYFPGLSGGFQGDDNLQIVDNPYVHSLSSVPDFFTSSTFFNGDQLVGSFYRPLMSTVYAGIYSMFGANPVPFHIVQLLLHVLVALVLYLVLKRWMRPAASFALSLVFLLHPVNSQAVLAIPSLQEPIFTLFGLLALLLTIRGKSFWLIGGLLFLSLLGKEAGVIFVALVGLYLLIYDRSRIKAALGPVLLAFVIYLGMRIRAVGFGQDAPLGPIGEASFVERMQTVPSVLAHYMEQVVAPFGLSNAYHWVVQSPTLHSFWLPLLAVLVVLALTVLGWLALRRQKSSRSSDYLFFASWVLIALLPYIQLIALDMTACDAWLYAVLPGILGLGYTAARSWLPRRALPFAFALVVVLALSLGARSFVRSMDYVDQKSLALADVQVAPENFFAMGNLSQAYLKSEQYEPARDWAQRSVDIFPSLSGYTNLGVAEYYLKDYESAERSYEKALEYDSYRTTYENLALVSFATKDATEHVQLLVEGLQKYPSSVKMWTYLALIYAENGQTSLAKKAIYAASTYGNVPSDLYIAIYTGKHLEVPVPGIDRVIEIDD